jgi:hypothetical protein
MSEITISQQLQEQALQDFLAANPKPEGAIVGYGILELHDEDGNLKQVEPFANLITDVGDAFHAQAVAYVTRAAIGAPTVISGMQVGTGSTAAAKSGAGGAIVTFSAGVALTAGYPTTNNLGGGLGVNTTYVATFAAGSGTGALTEAVLTNTGTIGSAALAAATIARIVFSTINKGASDSLTLTWNTKFLGA